MAPQSTASGFSGGLVLTRFYDDAQGSVDAQCGSLVQWQSWLDQLSRDLSYYRRANGSHLFLEKLTLEVYSCARTADNRGWMIPQPGSEIAEALTYPSGNGRSRIVQRFYDVATWGDYKFPAALSHEFGHAFHNWCGFYMDPRSRGPLQEVARAWEKMINLLHQSYGYVGQVPFNRDPGQEQFANAFRALLGTNEAPGNTRGSANTAQDPTVQGFDVPTHHPDWRLAFQLLPELSAFIEVYGALTDSLVWLGDRWQLTTTVDGPDCPAGTTVYQNDYYTQAGRTDGWFKLVRGEPVRFAPRYNRF